MTVEEVSIYTSESGLFKSVNYAKISLCVEGNEKDKKYCHIALQGQHIEPHSFAEADKEHLFVIEDGKLFTTLYEKITIFVDNHLINTITLSNNAYMNPELVERLLKRHSSKVKTCSKFAVNNTAAYICEKQQPYQQTERTFQ